MTVSETLWNRRAVRIARNGAPGRTRERRGAGRALLSAAPYLLPAVVLLAVFRLYPIAYGLWLSVTREGRWIGFGRYRVMLEDPTLHRALLNDLVFVAVLPLWIFLPLIVAVLIHGRIWLWKFFLAVFFLPAILSPVLLGIYYSLILGHGGPVNTLLDSVHLGSLSRDWLVDPGSALPVVLAVYMWSNIGVGVLFFTSALGSLDRELFEAALLDGCSWWQRLRLVIVPQLRPVFEFYATVTIIGIFTALLPLVYSLTGGGPANTTMVVDLYVYQTAFSFNNPDYATAMGMLVFAFALLFVLVELRLLKRLVRD